MAVAAPEKVGQMSMDEFIRRSEQDGPFEIIDGEVVPKMPNIYAHGKLSNQLSTLINVMMQGQGVAFVEMTFVLPDSYGSSWVAGSRIPDVMFVLQERIEAYEESMPDFGDKPLILIPDIVIEVVSPTDKYSDVQAKADRYLADGVPLVWVFDPVTQTVTQHTGDGISIYRVEDTLTAEAIVPDLQIVLKDIFGS